MDLPQLGADDAENRDLLLPQQPKILRALGAAATAKLHFAQVATLISTATA